MGGARKSEEVELEPDAWERFERAVGVVAKSPPQHRVAKKGKPKRNLAHKRGRAKRRRRD